MIGSNSRLWLKVANYRTPRFPSFLKIDVDVSINHGSAHLMTPKYEGGFTAGTAETRLAECIWLHAKEKKESHQVKLH